MMMNNQTKQESLVSCFWVVLTCMHLLMSVKNFILPFYIVHRSIQKFSKNCSSAMNAMEQMHKFSTEEFSSVTRKVCMYIVRNPFNLVSTL